MLTLLAALGCTEPEPTLSNPELPISELATSVQPENMAPPPELGPPIAMPWPAAIPCKEFGHVLVSGAYLERADGSLLASTGQQRARSVPPQDLVAGLVIRPDLDPVHITASCSDPRERVIWSCTADTGCTLELQRIGEPPELPPVLRDLDRAGLAQTVPSGAKIKRMEPLVRAGIEHSLSLLRACQAKGCAGEETIEALSVWNGPLPTPTVTEGTPWVMFYKQDQAELQLSCQPHACTLRSVGPIQTRLDLRADSQSLYVIPGRLDYRDEGQGPRVAFSGRLVTLLEPPEQAPEE
ncbi:MAG: hypothetical protein ACI9VR_003652 [Cognaticolwellia sp.]|jgi:hypothetical protein